MSVRPPCFNMCSPAAAGDESMNWFNRHQEGKVIKKKQGGKVIHTLL